MPKTANINLRIEPDIKAKADAVYASLGLSVTDAITGKIENKDLDK